MNQLIDQLMKHISAFEKLRIHESQNSGQEAWNEAFFLEFYRADARFRLAAKNLDFSYPDDPPAGDVQTQMGVVCQRFDEIVAGWKRKILITNIENEVALEYVEQSVELSEAISFDREHRSKIQSIIGKLRDEVNESSWMDKEKKQRVLKAVNSVQSEVDKETSNFHLVLGKIVDLGDALGKAGERAKPAFDRIEQLSNAVRGQRQQALAIEKDEDPLQIEDMREESEE
ncbi:hypothetical protein ABLN87_01735 [Ruegeria sp. SCPT10]|uniref:hypothetical protein n=1 Tax=Ruegeria sp. SCP10 TaxID=3141377 RepID=UPI003336427B